MKIKTDNLTGPALDYAVAKCHGKGLDLDDPDFPWLTSDGIADVPLEDYSPSTSWQEGGPIIEIYEIGIRRNAPCSTGREWEASGSITAKGAGYRWGYGPKPLIAAMRCFVASKLGEEVDIPDDLLPRDYGSQTEFHRETA
jgi:hypothetical protein